MLDVMKVLFYFDKRINTEKGRKMIKTDYDLLTQQAEALTKDCPHLVANLANISALLFTTIEDINWVGFYLLEEASAKLILGPFQGNPACIELPVGKGVCGTAAAEDRTQLVPDVHQFPGHIACDSASRSEIVIPVHKKRNGVSATSSNNSNDGPKENTPELTSTVIGVLDIDSPSLSRFTEEDKVGLEKLVAILEHTILF